MERHPVDIIIDFYWSLAADGRNKDGSPTAGCYTLEEMKSIFEKKVKNQETAKGLLLGYIMMRKMNGSSTGSNEQASKLVT